MTELIAVTTWQYMHMLNHYGAYLQLVQSYTPLIFWYSGQGETKHFMSKTLKKYLHKNIMLWGVFCLRFQPQELYPSTPCDTLFQGSLLSSSGFSEFVGVTGIPSSTGLSLEPQAEAHGACCSPWGHSLTQLSN